MSRRLRWRLQSESAECGLACIAICLQALGDPVDMAELRQRFPVSARGLNVRDVGDLCAALDLTVRAVRCEVEELGDLRTPAILHWNFNHFVVFLGRTLRGRLRIIDPATGEITMDAAEFSRAFTGVALEVSPAAGFQRRKAKSPLNLWSMLPLRGGVGGALAQALLLTLIMQAHVVASPFFVQLAVDEAALKGDLDLLATLAVGFGLFAVLNAATEGIRAFVLQRASSLLGWGMTSRLFHHMLRLPLPWFQRRRLADALTRFDSIEPIRALVANGFVSTVLDGLLSVVVLAMMLVYAAGLAGVVLAFTAILALLKLGAVPLSVRRAMRVLHCQIAEKGKRIETLRAMQTIKLMGGEASRERDWAGKFGETIKAQEAAAHFGIGVRAAQTLVESIGHVVVVYLAARHVLAGALSVGMLYAFMSYRQQFSARMLGLVEQLVAWRMLDMHSDRIADIALHRREGGIDRLPIDGFELDGRIELAGVHFRYALHERDILRGVNLRIAPGELIAIVGPSGGGKSTLLKTMIGLYEVTSGEVRYNGLPLQALGPVAVRAGLGVVMQDDELLSGSIGENVAFFDERPETARIWECLRLAAIDDEVRRMPMQLHTLIGDMGSSLSGGQRQRLLLARALYRRPQILFLDEATSNLDLERERRIHESLKGLSITRVIVTHRPETRRLADRVLVLRGGRLEGGFWHGDAPAEAHTGAEA